MQQMYNLVGQYACLSRTGTRDDQLWPVAIEHSIALLFIELFQIIFHFVLCFGTANLTLLAYMAKF